ncbi:MAG: hypothetical protein KDD06_14905 [Phaeodactylibacter sp.]|nr:hypothetical protein [Phaeodactylibacter sp.]MCB9286025.1 hypothetical protein [Lewinellaceae bacterium]
MNSTAKQAMRNISAILFTLIFLLPFSIQGQSLVEDTRALASALRALNRAETAGPDTAGFELVITRDTMAGDSIVSDTSRMPALARPQPPSPATAAEALAILYYYDKPGEAGEFTEPQLQAVLQRYRENPLMKEALEEEKLNLLRQSNDSLFTEAFQKKLQSLRNAPRHKMMQRLYSKGSISPSEYLSVSRSLKQYSTPPLSNVAMMKKAAESSNRNVSKGIVSAPDVIEGLFTFILERAQEEVAINFLERLLGEEVQLLDELFPSVAGTFDGHNFTYSNSFIERLRLAFYEDMQMIPVRLPELMLKDDYFEPLRDDPVAYNLFVVFTMSGMAQNGLSLDEILPVTNRYLFDNYGEARKAVNFHLSEQAYKSAEYDSLIATTERILLGMRSIHSELLREEQVLRDSIRAFKNDFPEAPSTLGMDRELRNPDYDINILLNGGNDSLGLGLLWLPDMLRGELSEDAVLRNNSIANYDKFFGKERSPQQWRAAGLELAKNLNGNWHKGNSIDGILRNRLAALAGFRLQIEQWESETDTLGALQRALRQAEAKRQALLQTIDSTSVYWGEQLSRDQKLALKLLHEITRDFRDIKFSRFRPNNPTKKKSLELMTERLLQIEQRLLSLNKEASEKQPDKKDGSPVLAYLESQKPVRPYSHIGPMIDKLSENLHLLQTRMASLEKAQASSSAKARDNAEPLLQLTELASQLAYGLRSGDPEKKWIGRDELLDMLNGGLEQQIFLGLLQQRLLDIPNIGPLAPHGLSQLMELTIRDLPLLIDSTGLELKDSLSFYRKATFVVNTFNRILELPLLQKPGGLPGEFSSLVEQNAKLAGLPELSGQALDLIFYLSNRDHRHAVSSSIRLFSALDGAIGDSKEKKKGKQGAIIHFFRDYGDFVADLVDAESGTEVEGLMKSIADPPGSARAKRRQDFTVALNAYLGANFGYESWRDEANKITENFWAPAPTMPVGISISRLFGKKEENGPEHRLSLSAFLSFLDLGGLLTYRSGDSIDAESAFSFKNVFKPGLQIHINPRNTPFYIGIGGQVGSQYLQSGGDEVSVKSTRGFVAFGIDVPIKMLYQK